VELRGLRLRQWVWCPRDATDRARGCRENRPPCGLRDRHSPHPDQQGADGRRDQQHGRRPATATSHVRRTAKVRPGLAIRSRVTYSKNLGTLEPWNPGTLELWDFGTLEPWNFGTLEPLDSFQHAIGVIE
jgi:hypothetical protein